MLLPKPEEASSLDLLAKLEEAVFRDLKPVVVVSPAEVRRLLAVVVVVSNALDNFFLILGLAVLKANFSFSIS